jgi:hypothetical protein
MKKTLLSGWNLTCFLPLAFACLSVFALRAQSQYSIQIIPPLNEGTQYTFRINNSAVLPVGSLVFFRFSDGFHMFKTRSAASNVVEVRRSFPSILPAGQTPGVVAYIAEKGGPLGIALPQNQGSISSCPGCPHLPSVLPASEQIRLGYSWQPFIEDVNPFVEPGTSPLFSTPDDPWFFLIVSMRPGSGNQTVEVNIPPGFTYQNAIFRNTFGASQSHPQSSPVSSISSPFPGRVNIALNEAVSYDLNVYLVVKGTPILGADYTFAAKMLKNNTPVGTSNLTLQGRQYPHDPNILSVSREVLCPGIEDAQPLHYRVEFQNTGQGPTEQVQVVVQLPDNQGIVPEILSYNGPQGIDIIPSVQASPGDPYPTMVSFYFPTLALPGLYQLPNPNPSETIGWVEFSLAPADCLPEEMMATKAYVYFFAGEFEEVVPTNSLIQNVVYVDSLCPEPDPYCSPWDPNAGGRSIQPEPTTAGTFAPECYPSPFTGLLNVSAHASPVATSLSVTITDVTGKIWASASAMLQPGEPYVRSIDTGAMPAGVYFAHFVRDGQTFTRKIIKSRI